MTRPRTGIQLLAGAIALTSLTAACGLKPDATAALKTAPAGTTAANGTTTGGAPGTPGAPGAATAPGAPGAPSGTIAGGPTTTTGGGTTTTGGSTSGGTTSGGTTSGGGACGVPHGGSTTGITASTLNIGLHAPLTGTGTPFPNDKFQAGAATFWQQPGHEVCGRKVQVEFKDDTYTPSGARNVCSQMATRDFLVVGGGGTDQIQACATTPAIQQNDVPYLSPGVTDNGLIGLNNYFAVSLSYGQQGTLVLRNAQQQGMANPTPSNQPSTNETGQNAKWAIVTANTKNFEGAKNGIEQALNAAHIPYKDYRIDQNGGNYQSAATQFGSQLALDGFKTIFVDVAPGYFVFMSGGYYGETPTGGGVNWVGPGVTYTEVTVAQYLCNASKNQVSGHAWFLSPAPGIDHATAEFKRAYGGKYDDIEWALWGLSETLWKLLNKANANLTRQNFIASTEHAALPAGSVYPPVDYAHHGGHFGGTGAWVQKVNCSETEPDQNQNGGWDTVGSTWLKLY